MHLLADRAYLKGSPLPRQPQVLHHATVPCPTHAPPVCSSAFLPDLPPLLLSSHFSFVPSSPPLLSLLSPCFVFLLCSCCTVFCVEGSERQRFVSAGCFYSAPSLRSSRRFFASRRFAPGDFSPSLPGEIMASTILFSHSLHCKSLKRPFISRRTLLKNP